MRKKYSELSEEAKAKERERAKGYARKYRERVREEQAQRILAGEPIGKPPKPRYDLKKWQENPPLFLEENFGVRLWSKQREILIAVRDYPRVTVRSGNALGKSLTAAGGALWFLYCFYPSTVITTAPTNRQVRDVIWREMAWIYYRAKRPMGGDFYLHTTRLNLEENWFAEGLTSDEPDKFQGYHNENLLIIVEESSGVDEPIFEAIEGCLASGNAKLLLIGNPMSLSGTFWASHRDERTSLLYKQIHISAFDSPNVTGEAKIPGLVTKEWIEQRKQEWGEDNPLYQIRVLGEFPQQGIDTLIPLQWILKAQKQQIEPEGIKILGVDVARFGDDETVACLRQGNKVLKFWRWSKLDSMEVANHLAFIIKSETVPLTNIDATFIYGDAVIDRLVELGFKRNKEIKGINVSLTSKTLNLGLFLNLRAKMFWDLRTKFQQGEISIPNDLRLTAQLSGLKYDFREGKLRMESKEEMRSRGMKSPDMADALAFAFIEKSQQEIAWVWA